MAYACEVSAMALQAARTSIKAGATTLDVDHAVAECIKKAGAKASFLNYNGFKGNACVSVNDELIHGIPSKKKVIREGDIVTVDVGAYIGGFHGDNAYTFTVGEVDKETLRLLNVTQQSLYEGIKKAVVGNRIGDIGAAIQAYVEQNGFFIVKEYIGHGVGRDLHEDPEVPNYGKAGRGARLVPGMTIAIEPMVNYSTAECLRMKDGWTVVEKNHKPSAHFEHTIAITEGEPVILTRFGGADYAS